MDIEEIDENTMTRPRLDIILDASTLKELGFVLDFQIKKLHEIPKSLRVHYMPQNASSNTQIQITRRQISEHLQAKTTTPELPSMGVVTAAPE